MLLELNDTPAIGHLSPGQWKDPTDKSATKTGLDYWINLAKILERGDINALFLADTYGGYDRTIDSHINRLRSKVEENPDEPKLVLTVWGVGYKFNDEV